MPTRSRSGNVRSVVTRANGLHVGFAVLLRVVDLGTLLQKPARRVLCWRTADLVRHSWVLYFIQCASLISERSLASFFIYVIICYLCFTMFNTPPPPHTHTINNRNNNTNNNYNNNNIKNKQ